MRISDWSSDVCSADRLDARLGGRFAHRAAGADFEGQGRRVDVVIGAVRQVDFEVDDREADQMTGLGRLAEALFHRRDIFARDVAALDLVEELVARTALAGDEDRKSTRLNSSH